MPNFLITWLVAASSLVFTSYIVPGMEVQSFQAAAIAAVVLGLANAIVRPLLVVLTLPVTILTLGLFLFVVNALTLQLVGAVTPGFIVGNIFSALMGSVVLSFVSGAVGKFVQPVPNSPQIGSRGVDSLPDSASNPR
ncbi:phage holin family protein [Microcoleus sp. FACHB-68]|uniref:phage holin family protein n=1 Tax=Microcoleus sp. FACHB-68 TaxID=2692826 RepID=UPI0016866DE9|nr:phage holin family protein [Microcoleus sp. FACHB-68]MBD1939914.1 phage holin family protein [Microcoleus sp. FACHB-68]